MAALKIKYSIRSMLLLITAVAVVCAYVVLPTWRARQFAQAVKLRRYDIVQKMVPSAYGNLKRELRPFSAHARITISPVSISDLWNGTRTVVVSDFPLGDGGAFKISYNDKSSSALFLLSSSAFIPRWLGDGELNSVAPVGGKEDKGQVD